MSIVSTLREGMSTLMQQRRQQSNQALRQDVERVLRDDLPAEQAAAIALAHDVGPERFAELCEWRAELDQAEAMLGDQAEFDAETAPTQRAGWTAYQLADERLHGQLHDARGEFASLSNPNQRRAVREAFDAYAYQWY